MKATIDGLPRLSEVTESDEWGCAKVGSAVLGLEG